MNEYYTTTQIAEKMGVCRQVIAYHIRQGNLKATKKNIVWTIKKDDYYNFYDWYEFDKGHGGIQKIPTIKEYDNNPNIYNDDTKVKIERNRQILKDRLIDKMKYADISEKYILKIITIRQIVTMNKVDTEY